MATHSLAGQKRNAYGGDDVITELAAFLPASVLGVVCACSRGALKASDEYWRSHLKTLGHLPTWSGTSSHRAAWQGRVGVMTGSDARREHSLCMGGLQDALRAASSDPPTPEHVLQFVARVRSHHSWYKHLPIEQGAVFQFGMSPTAGMRFRSSDIVEYVHGDGTEFHYTWSSTEDYRKRFHCFVWKQVEMSGGIQYTVDTCDAKPLLMPNLPTSFIPVTACIYLDSTHYDLLKSIYHEYKTLRAAGSVDFSQLAHSASRWTRRKTGMGLSDAIIADLARLYDFEVRHPIETWEQRSKVLLQDAQDLCRALFPHHNEEDLQLEVDWLLSSKTDPGGEGPSGSAKRADGARAQVRMVQGLLEWISFAWGSGAVPSISLSMADKERDRMRRLQRYRK